MDNMEYRILVEVERNCTTTIKDDGLSYEKELVVTEKTSKYTYLKEDLLLYSIQQTREITKVKVKML